MLEGQDVEILRPNDPPLE